MKKIYEDDLKVCYADDIQVRIEMKSGGTITTLKHDPSWHETATHVPREGCIFCKIIQPDSSKREDSHKLVYREPNPETMSPYIRAKFEEAKARCGTRSTKET